MQSSEDDPNVISGINVTPLVDVALVLLIIFMVTATFVSEQGLKVNLPKVLTRENAPSPAITVALGKDGQLRLMKKEVTLEGLKTQMALEARLDPTVKVLVKIDRDLAYADVAEVLDAIKLAGVNKVALAMDRK